MSKRIFVSHTTPDDEVVNVIADALRKEGFTPWIDHDPENGVEPGSADWEKAIRDELAITDAVLFVMSNKSLASTYCKRECSRAETLKKPIYVARLEEIGEVNEIWLYLEGRQYAPFVAHSDTEMKLIIRALTGERAPDVPTAVRAQTITGVDTMRLHLQYLNNPLRGRDQEIAQIQGNVGPHVLQIVGTGGLGKSRLAAEVAMNYPNGAVWQRCSQISEAAELLNLLRNHLNLRADTSMPDVLAVLGEKSPLVVIDNAEDFPADADKRREYVDLLKLITDSKHVPVLLTTRAIWTEFKRREIPLNGVPLKIASQIAADFAKAEEIALTESEARELAEKGRCHPRLIEFAVGQLHERSISSILRQLNELKHHEIQNALDEMIVKSVRQMAEQVVNGADAETLMRRMTILQATFPLDAIKAIAPDVMKADEDRLEDALVTLQRWQFVRRDPAIDSYSLGDLVREALGQPRDDVFLQYATYYTVRARDIFSLPQEKWKSHELDFPNILVLGDRLVERIPYLIQTIDEQAGKGNEILLIASAFAMNTIKFVAHRREIRREAWLDMGLTIATTQNNTGFRLSFLSALGLIWSELEEFEKAKGAYKQTLSLGRTMGIVEAQVSALIGLGTVWYQMSNYQKAKNCFYRALKLNQSVGDQNTNATILSRIALYWSHLGDNRRALEFIEQALHSHRVRENMEGEAAVLSNKSSILFALGEKQMAIDCLEHALSLFVELGDRMSEMSICRQLTVMNVEGGNIDQAKTYMARCIELGEQIESPRLNADREILELIEQMQDDDKNA